MLENYEKPFDKSDLEYDRFWLHNNQYILNQCKNYDNDLYKEPNELLDLFCIQVLREIVYCFSEESIFDIETKIYDFICIIDDLEFDFHIFSLLAGEEYLKSDQYDYEADFEIYRFNIVYYLIENRYGSILTILLKHYRNSDNLLLNLLDGTSFKERYMQAIQEVTEFEDIYDYVDVMKLIQWKEDGFTLSGE